MFNVSFYLEETCILFGTMKFLPREGEKVRINNILYKVTMVSVIKVEVM